MLQTFISCRATTWNTRQVNSVCRRTKSNRKHDLDVILGQVVPCRKLRWTCRKRSNHVAWQLETQGKSTVFVARLNIIENMILTDKSYLAASWGGHVTSIQIMSWNKLKHQIGQQRLSHGGYTIGESTMWSFWHSMATSWSIMAARTQMEQVKLEQFNLKSIKSTED